MLIWTGGGLLATIFLVPETYRPVLFKLHNQKMRRNDKTPPESSAIDFHQRSITNELLRSLIRPLQMLTLEPMCLCLCIHSALLLGTLYLLFGAFPLVFMRNHDFMLWQVGLTFIGMIIGILCGILTSPYWQRNYTHLVKISTSAGGTAEPEFRLPQVIMGAVLVPMGLFWFGFTTYSSIHWIVPVIGSSVFGMG